MEATHSSTTNTVSVTRVLSGCRADSRLSSLTHGPLMLSLRVQVNPEESRTDLLIWHLGMSSFNAACSRSISVRPRSLSRNSVMAGARNSSLLSAATRIYQNVNTNVLAKSKTRERTMRSRACCFASPWQRGKHSAFRYEFKSTVYTLV